MSRLRRFGVWLRASRWRYALYWASGMSAGTTMMEAVRHHDTAGFPELANNAIEWFVMGYLMGLLMSLPSRSKRPS